jgi:hypothetical protein
MLVKEEGYCGYLGRGLSHTVYKSSDCFRLAQEKGATAFSMGRDFRHGHCYVELEQFSCDEYKKWEAEPDKPHCSTHNGNFAESLYYDWYAIEPTCSE